MTLTTLVLWVALFAALLTILFKYVLKKVDLLWLSFLQNFAGVLFIVSGAVKIIDPLGTAYKMMDYFEQFELTFEPTFLSFLAPLFPVLSTYASTFAIIVIVLEILLGLMLVLGHRRKLTAWLFLILVIFFTFLTGFTFMTGYVPSDANFFDFSQWTGEHNENNMRVTDCGCFGDFIKLKPKISFLKDLVLLIPAFLFIFFWNRKHQLFSISIRDIIIGLATLGLTIYGLSNFVWDIPDFDFRPFKEGAAIRENRQNEMDAQAAIKIKEVRLTSKNDGKTIAMDKEQYFKVFKQYPEEEYEIEYVYTEPAIQRTKLSDFAIFNEYGEDMADSILSLEGYSFWVISQKLKGNITEETSINYDTIYTLDTLNLGDDSDSLVRVIDYIDEQINTQIVAEWDENFVNTYKDKVNPLLQKALNDKLNVYTFAGKASYDGLKQFKKDVDLPGDIFEADNILLKTIIRSNPGVVLVKDGVILKKWHINQLPDYEFIKTHHLKR